MSKVLTVFGATGHQGGSVVDFVLNDAELSKEYALRAITRDVNSSKAEELRTKGVDVVAGDITDKASLERAFEGAHTVFLMTNADFGPNAYADELNSAKSAADIAVAKGVKYLIFSTLPSYAANSKGKYTKVSAFEAKYDAEQYIRTLPIKSAFVALGAYMSNWQDLPFQGPKKAADGTYVLSWSARGQTNWPLIDARANTGNFVAAILAEPDAFVGKVLAVAERRYTLDEICEIMSRSSGKKVVYKEVSNEEFARSLPFGGEVLAQAFRSCDEFNHWGPVEKELIEWSVSQARGKLNSFEDYLKARPLVLE